MRVKLTFLHYSCSICRAMLESQSPNYACLTTETYLETDMYTIQLFEKMSNIKPLFFFASTSWMFVLLISLLDKIRCCKFFFAYKFLLLYSTGTAEVKWVIQGYHSPLVYLFYNITWVGRHYKHPAWTKTVLQEGQMENSCGKSKLKTSFILVS